MRGRFADLGSDLAARVFGHVRSEHYKSVQFLWRE